MNITNCISGENMTGFQPQLLSFNTERTVRAAVKPAMREKLMYFCNVNKLD